MRQAAARAAAVLRRHLLLWACALPLARAADAAREVHGAADAWAEPGLAWAWGVLRGGDESSTRVVIRIEADPLRFGTLTAWGRDPFGGGAVAIALLAGADGSLRINLPRSHFADYPRTELRVQFRGQDAVQWLVYFQGVPDTTPEWITEAQLEADLRRRIARARGPL